jgi:hypothetical protein
MSKIDPCVRRGESPQSISVGKYSAREVVLPRLPVPVLQVPRLPLGLYCEEDDDHLLSRQLNNKTSRSGKV